MMTVPDSPRTPSSLALLACLLIVLAAFLRPAGSEAQDRARGRLESWQRALQEIGRELLAQLWEKAERWSIALADEMADEIVGGVGADLLLEMAASYRAVALVGQGRIEEGIWHWQVAQPLILDSRGEVTLVWSALEALHAWSFEPGRRDGVAEPTLYKLTVSFVVPVS